MYTTQENADTNPYAKPDAVYEGHSFQVEDCAAAVENMLLAITALGYATVWIDGWLRVEDRGETIGEMIGLSSNKQLALAAAFSRLS